MSYILFENKKDYFEFYFGFWPKMAFFKENVKFYLSLFLFLRKQIFFKEKSQILFRCIFSDNFL